MYRHDSQQVLNLFSGNNAISAELQPSRPIPDIYLRHLQDDEEIKRREEAAFMKQLERFDENVKHAILLRREKDNKTEFTRKLEALNEKIVAYRSIF